MDRAWLAALIALAAALSGCADAPEPDPGPTGTDAVDAYTVSQENPVSGDATLLGFFGHSGSGNRVPWPIGPVSTYEHMHLSGGGNRALDQGTGQAWYGLHLDRSGEERKVVLTKVTSEVSIERSFDATHFGWPIEHDGVDCQIASSTDAWAVASHDAWNTALADVMFAEFRDTIGGQPIMLYVPTLTTTGPDCGRSTPLGFDFLPQTNVWAIFLTDIDMFLQGGVFGDSIVALVDAGSGDLLSVTPFTGTWGPSIRHAETHEVNSDLPGGPGAPQRFEFNFGVEAGATQLNVATRLLSAPDFRDTPLVSISGPDSSESTTGDHTDWTIDNPSAGAWMVVYEFNQAQPAAAYTIDVAALTH